MPRNQESKDGGSNTVLITIIVAVIGLIGTLGAAYLNYRATLDPIIIVNTQVAIQATSTKTNTIGPCIENDFTDKNQAQLNWPIATNSFAGTGIEQTSMDNGKYIWVMNASTPVLFIKQLILNQGVITQNRDYELEVEFQKIKGLNTTQYGIILSEEGKLKFYKISISPYKQELSVDKRTPDGWVSLIPNTHIDAINQNGVNKLKIVANGTTYQVNVNDGNLHEFTDADYKNQVIELATDINEVDSDVRLEIDNFRLCNIQ